MARAPFQTEIRDGKVYAKVPLSHVLKDVDRDGTDFMAAVGRLYDENAKLREQVDAAHMSRLLTENENESLRELVQSAVRCITDVPNCDSCALGEQVSGVWVCHLIGAAKELGAEVDA